MRILISIAFILLTGCTRGVPTLSDPDQQLVRSLNFDASLMARVRSEGVSFERLRGLTSEYESYLASGLVLSTEPEQGRLALASIREVLGDSEYSAYLYDESYGYGSDKIAIVRNVDDYAYLAIVRTDGINYDLEHDDVLARYRQWDQRYGLSLNGAGGDWLEAVLTRPPEDWIAFAQEVYEFCPDVVDQGTGDVQVLAEELRRGNFVFLWWD